MIKVRRMSGRPMTKEGQLPDRPRRIQERSTTKEGQQLDRLKRMFLLMVDQPMIKARETSNKPDAKPMLMDSKHTIKARRLTKLLKDLLNSGVSKLKGKLKIMADRLMTKEERTSDRPSNGANRLREKPRTMAGQLTIKAGRMSVRPKNGDSRLRRKLKTMVL